MEEPDPLRPEGAGMLGELRPPERPAEPPLEPEDPPEEPLDEGGEEVGEGMEVEDCWLAQPPIRNAETVPIAVT